VQSVLRNAEMYRRIYAAQPIASPRATPKPSPGKVRATAKKSASSKK
jgi:hypothetical protein